MVGYKVDNHFQTGIVCTLYQCFEFIHPAGHVYGQVRVDIVVIGNSIRATGMSFDYIRVVLWYTVGRIVGIVRMLYHAGIPHVGSAKALDRIKHRGGDVVELARAVFG